MCVWCQLRSMNSPFAIPCRHIFHEGSYVNLNLIHKRFLRTIRTFQSLPNTLQISETPIPRIKNRTNLITRIEPFANLYGRNSALTDLENLKVRRNAGMPPTIAQSGAAFCHPSHNTFCGRHSTKKKRHCSKRNSTNHDSRNCPY